MWLRTPHFSSVSYYSSCLLYVNYIPPFVTSVFATLIFFNLMLATPLIPLFSNSSSVSGWSGWLKDIQDNENFVFDFCPVNPSFIRCILVQTFFFSTAMSTYSVLLVYNHRPLIPTLKCRPHCIGYP